MATYYTHHRGNPLPTAAAARGRCYNCITELPDDASYNRKYCSKECRAAYNRRVRKFSFGPCEWCGGKISETRGEKSRYCSVECVRLNRASALGKTVYCDYCEKPLPAGASPMKRYCDQQVQGQDRGLQEAG